MENLIIMKETKMTGMTLKKFAKEVGQDYEAYIKFVWENPGRYRRSENSGKTNDGYWFTSVWYKKES